MNFKHYLVFSDFEVEVLEPIGFDASNFVIEQGNYARDTYTFNDKVDFIFYDEKGDELEVPRTLNNGVVLSHQESGLRFLIEENKRNGTESIVKYKLQLDNIDFSIAQLDFGEAETDNTSYFKCKLIQDTQKALIKKRNTIKVDAFSNKDLDDNTITPITTQRLLLTALPINGVSTWQSPEGWVSLGLPTHPFTDLYYYYNPCKQSIKYEIENSLSWLSALTVSNFDDYDSMAEFAVLEAVEQLTNVKIEITDFLYFQTVFGSAESSFRIVWGYSTLFPIGAHAVYDSGVMVGGSFAYNSDITYTIPVVPKGAKVWIFGRTRVGTGSASTFQTISAFNTKISATSTAIDSVIEAVRYVDLIKQNYKGIGSNLPVNAPKFDVGGEFYDNMCYTGKLIRQITDKPFYLELKETVDSLMEFNGDAQINDNEVRIGQYEDFYQNIDMGGFLIAPDKNFKYTKNGRYLINEFSLGYEHYEEFRGESGTLQSIHTDTQWYIPANNSMDKKDVKTPFTRDSMRIESVKRRNTRITDNSEDTDDEIFISDVTSLAPNSRRKFTAFLRYSSNGSRVVILSDDSFSWNLLGFNVGNTIKVNGVNVVVESYTAREIVLIYTSVVNSGTMVFIIDYPLTNVQYVTRTNQGLIYSANLPSADKFGNLRYSIKRNIRYWYAYLATAGKFIVEKSIKNTFFKNNGDCITQFTGEPLPIKENDPIVIQDITDYKILNQNIITTTVTATFESVKELIGKVQNDRGFVRVQDQEGRIVKGYIKKLDHNWKYNELKLTLEEKNESDFLVINYASGILTINEVGYPTKIVTEKMYNIFNGFIQFFDENNINLCNRTYFDKVKYNGVIYNSIDELLIAIG